MADGLMPGSLGAWAYVVRWSCVHPRSAASSRRSERALLHRRWSRSEPAPDPSDPLREVDILVSPPIPAARLVAGAVIHQMDEISVHIIGIDDLIEMKRVSGRAQDLADVALLERLRGPQQ